MFKTLRKIFHKHPRTGAPAVNPTPETSPAPVEEPVVEMPKLKLDSETVQILVEDKVATGG